MDDGDCEVPDVLFQPRAALSSEDHTKSEEEEMAEPHLSLLSL